MICEFNRYKGLFCTGLLALTIATVQAQVLDVEELCVPYMKPGVKEGMHLMTTIRGEICDTRLYCSNFRGRELSLRNISIYHDCKIDGKLEKVAKNSYYDFGNSLHSLKENYQGINAEFNSVLIKELKVYATAYGFDEDKKLISRAIRSLVVDHTKLTNTN